MRIKEMILKKLKEKQNKQKAKMVVKVTTGAMAGIVSGVVGGVLMAPKSGKETRDDIAETAKGFGENAVNKKVKIKDILNNKVIETKSNVNIAKEKISEYLSDKKEEKNNNETESKSE